ncbi:MAG: serine acetyltransferase [Terrimicrobiaceae bacterium]
MIRGIFQDWDANRGNPRSQCVLVMFRMAQCCHRLPPGLRWLGWPHLAAYHVIVIWELGIELNHKATIGPGLRLYHGTALVVHEKSVIGKNCTLRHCTTIGNRREADDVPVLGDGVEIGCNSVIIGRITVGDGAKIGAGSVVLHDVAPGDTVAGNPARKLCAGGKDSV